MLRAIETGFVQAEIQKVAFEFQRAVEKKEQIVVGVNDFIGEEARQIPTLRIDEETGRSQTARLKPPPARPVLTAWPPPLPNSSAVPTHRKIFSRPSSMPSKPTLRSAKSPTPSAAFSASIRNPWSSRK